MLQHVTPRYIKFLTARFKQNFLSSPVFLSVYICASCVKWIHEMRCERMDYSLHLDQSELLLFCKAEQRVEYPGGSRPLLRFLHTSSFSSDNPLALTQLPPCAGPSDTISICCNYREDPHPPPLCASQTHTHTEHTEHTAHWCNSCCLGGDGRL